MHRILFPILIIFAGSSWSWIDVKLTSERYTSEMRLTPWVPLNFAVGSATAKTSTSAYCEGSYVFDGEDLFVFFPGPEGFSSMGGCADEDLIIYLGGQGQKVFTKKILQEKVDILYEASFFEAEDPFEKGEITITAKRLF